MKQIASMALAAVLLLQSAVAQKQPDDARIYDMVKMRLANDADIKGGNLEVEVNSGVVTVRGRVDKERARAKVDRVAKKVKGVVSVVNQVKVEP
ncbi:MAG: BON domain-containing protein [Bryobacter sp.]|jgi:osmotically-inducible protein OsmY|nr:BON domain-containing protein [Bryobacter sp. CoA8 C33]